MIFSIIFLVVMCCILAYLLVVSLLKNVELADHLDDVEFKVSECLTVIEACHAKFEAKSKLEVFFDDPVIKETVSDLKDSRDNLEAVVNVLSQIPREDVDDADGDEKEEN